MSAILELKETPKSCYVCDIVQKLQTSSSHKFIFCGHSKNDVSSCIESRHPDCPLKITEDNLRWKYSLSGKRVMCPKCKSWYKSATGECPSCGIKLLPPEEN